jgi:hypothetical protein
MFHLHSFSEKEHHRRENHSSVNNHSDDVNAGAKKPNELVAQGYSDNADRVIRA